MTSRIAILKKARQQKTSLKLPADLVVEGVAKL